MPDVFSKSKRSEIMRAVLGQQTGPERRVHQILSSLRFKPQLNLKSLPGSPDFAFPRRRKVIFVHGCFWHRHACEAGRSTPASHREYWQRKFDRNQRRDAAVRSALRADGWSILTLWECQLRPSADPRNLARRIQRFLRGTA